MAQKEHMSDRAKIGILFILLVLGFATAILASAIKVTWVDGDMWRSRAEDLTRDFKPQKATRGNIYSSDGKILATTVPECDLYLDFMRKPLLDKRGNIQYVEGTKDTLFYTAIVDSNYNKYLDSVCLILHNNFPDTSAQWFHDFIDSARKAKKPKGCVRIRQHVPYSDWMRICKFPGWRKGVVKYVSGKSVIHYKRFKTYGNMAESVIGFETGVEKYSGLEGYYDSILRGKDGLVLHRRLAWGSWIPVGRRSNIAVSSSDSVRTDSIPGHPVINGQDIVSTIDTRLQDIAHYSLERSLRRYGSTAGCAILIEVETGNVLVCSSLVRDTAGRYRESANRNVPLSDLYEPGSIFKPVLLTAMYNDPKVDLDTAMLLPVGTKRFSTKSAVVVDHDSKGNAMVPLWKAVATSSNVAFCELAWRYYEKRRDTLLSQVGAIFPYNPIGVDIKGPEYKGTTNTLIYDNNFVRFCYGYTSSVSPLRMATFYNAIANGGRMVKPRFCKGVIRNGKLEEFPIQMLNERICSEEIAHTIRDMLVGVVEGGTGDNIKNDTYTIAGKTGTAVVSPNAHTSNATFVGFFPADKPKYTCLVLMRDITLFGRNAAPVFLDIADCVVSLDKELDCRPTIQKLAEKRKNDKNYNVYALPTVTKAPQADIRQDYRLLGINYGKISKLTPWCIYDEADTLASEKGYEPYQIKNDLVPNCYGMTIKDALLLCRSVGLDVTFEGHGKVVSQEPKGRTPIGKNNKVHLKLRTK